MKKTLAVLMAALLVAACFATVGSAADMTVAFIENTTATSFCFRAPALLMPSPTASRPPKNLIG